MFFVVMFFEDGSEKELLMQAKENAIDVAQAFKDTYALDAFVTDASTGEVVWG